MAEDRDHDGRTEKPTLRRLEKAREEGQVARAHGIAGAAVLLTGAALISVAGGQLIDRLELALRLGLGADPAALGDPAGMLTAGLPVIEAALGTLIGALLLCAVVAFFADIAIGGWVFSSRPLAPDVSRIDPVAGFGRLFSRTAFAEIVKALARFLVLGAVAFGLARLWAPDFMHLAAETWPRALSHAALGWNRMFITLAMASAGVMALEAPYQLWAFRDRLKMTRQEVRDELRELEGSPQTRRRIRALRARVARMRMMTEVAKADVVIVNPEHFAAALRYRDGEMRAPRLVAKGTGLIASRIREVAGEHDIPVIEAPPLARAICRYVELEDEIPIGLYPPVAEVLAYVYRLRAARQQGGPEPPLPRAERLDPPPEYPA